MAGQINFGDRLFNVSGKGRLPQSNVTKDLTRFINAQSNQALTTINGVAAFAATLTLSRVSQLIKLKRVIIMAYFVDSSSGAIYNVSPVATWYPYASNFANVDFTGGNLPTFLNFNELDDLDIIITLDSLSQIAIDVRVYGGDIVAQTSQTPGVGDQVQFSLTLVYEPL